MPSARRSFDLCDVNIHVARYGTNGSTRVVFNTYRNRSVQQLAKAIIVDCYAWFMTPYSSRKHTDRSIVAESTATLPSLTKSDVDNSVGLDTGGFT